MSFTEQYLDSCGLFKDAVLSILATIAKQERIRLSERTIAGLEKAASKGAPAGTAAVVVDHDRLAQLDEEGWTTREIAEEMGMTQATVWVSLDPPPEVERYPFARKHERRLRGCAPSTSSDILKRRIERVATNRGQLG